VLASVFEQDYVTVAPVADAGSRVRRQGPEGRDRRTGKTHARRAANWSSRSARLRDEIRRLEALDLGLEPPPAPSASQRPRRDRTPEPMVRARWLRPEEARFQARR